MTALADRLAAAASLEGDDGAIRVRATFEPGAGAGTKVSPPTYPDPSPYVTEQRRGPDGEQHTTVLLDSRQSQANRCEEALERAVSSGRIRLPLLVLQTSVGDHPLRITSLSAPHRSRDAYFRDAETLDGIPFDHTDLGKALAGATAVDATPYYRHSPTDLVYGVWDSHRGLRLATKFPRVYTSEMIGWDSVEGKRAAGRFDLLTSGGHKVSGAATDWSPSPTGKTRLSEIGLGAIPPSLTRTGGMTVGSIERMATLSFAGLARIRVGADEAQHRAARTVLATLALLGDRLAFATPGLFLRSGCDLVLGTETIEWVQPGGVTQPVDLSPESAVALLEETVGTAEVAGLAWNAAPVMLRPQAKLQAEFDYAHRTAPEEGE